MPKKKFFIIFKDIKKNKIVFRNNWTYSPGIFRLNFNKEKVNKKFPDYVLF